MKRWSTVVFIVGLVLGTALGGRAAEEKKTALDTETKEAFELFKKTDSKMQSLIDAAVGYVVFGSVVKGAAGIGAAHGDGEVFENGGKLLGTATVTQVTLGFQLGGQEYAEMILFENKDALDAFKTGKFAFSAQVSAVAAAEGAAANAKFQQGVLVFTIAKGGLMYEASIGGQKFKFKPLSNK